MDKKQPPPSRRQDLTGKEFGLLTALFPFGHTNSGHAIWTCGCSCGNPEPAEFSSRELLSNGIDSCGCKPRRLRKDGKAYRHYAKPNTEPDGLYIVAIQKAPNKHTFVTLSNGTVETMQTVRKIRYLSFRTINARIEEYGLNSPLVLYSGTISQKILDHFCTGKEVKRAAGRSKWKRSNCRRDGINCERYSECAWQRCGIGPKFIAPQSTDTCYREPKIIRNLYPSALAAMSNFVTVGY